MVRIKNYARLNISGGTKPGCGDKSKQKYQARIDPEQAKFCTDACPHPKRPCGRLPCDEFLEKFRRVRK